MAGEVRRKAIPKKLRAFIAVRQGGICFCGCGEKLMPGFPVDHQPSLELRMWDEVAQDTIPPSNDPAYMFGMTVPCHRRKTVGPRGPHTTLDSDVHAISKGRRIRGEVGNGPKTKWAKRPMGQRFEPRSKDINDD